MIAYFVAYFSHIFAYFDFPFHRIIPPPPDFIIIMDEFANGLLKNW